MNPVDDLQALLARDAIRNCLVRLARGEDRRHPAMIAAAYWPDAKVDYGVFRGGFDEYLAWVVPGSEAIRNTQHVLGQTYVEVVADAARAETHVVSYHRIDYGEADHDTCIGGRYLDTLEKRDGEWRIARRLMLYDWCQDWGASIDWSQGVMGLPFSHEHFSGRAKGDYSVDFFAKREGSA